MFLNSMGNEEKEKFLEFAYKLAQVDGDYAAEEEEIINSYKAELGIKDIVDTNSIDELIDFFSKRSEHVKKIVLFEVYGLICADNKIEKSEQDVFDKIKTRFMFPEELIKNIVDVAEELQSVYDKIYDVLG